MCQSNTLIIRGKLLKLMQDNKFSVETRFLITQHIAKLEIEQGDKLVEELIQAIEDGITEQEFKKKAGI